MSAANVNQLINTIKTGDADARYAAWRAAGPAGAAAVAPLAELIDSTDKGASRAATEALGRVAHYAARPSAPPVERQAVAVELLRVATAPRPRMVRAEALHLLGFVGNGNTVPPLARLLNDPEVREDARLALERIPGPQSLRALEEALRRAPADFKPNLQQSLHNRRLTRASVGTQPSR